MSYLQQFGVSRISPLNVSVDGKEKKEENPASEIIEKNNEESFADVGMDVFNQLKDKFKGKSTLGKIGMVGNAIRTKGQSLIHDVDTSKLDSDRLDDAQDYATIASGGLGLTGYGQVPSLVMDIGNTLFSGKRAVDSFVAGDKSQGFKNLRKGGATALTIAPGVGEYKAIQKGMKYSKKAKTAIDQALPEAKGPGSAIIASVPTAPMSITGKVAGWLAKKFSN